MKLREYTNIYDLPLHDEDKWPEDDQMNNYMMDLDLEDKFGLDGLDYDRIAARLSARLANNEPYQPQHADNTDFDPSELEIPLTDFDNAEMSDKNSLNDEFGEENFEDNEFGDELSNTDETGTDAEDGMGTVEDPNFQGIIRTVRGANLVYKRKQADDTYTELWVMNTTKDMKKDSQIRRAILAGTDINPQTQESEDGKQSMSAWAQGNVQFIELISLPN